MLPDLFKIYLLSYGHTKFVTCIQEHVKRMLQNVRSAHGVHTEEAESCFLFISFSTVY